MPILRTQSQLRCNVAVELWQKIRQLNQAGATDLVRASIDAGVGYRKGSLADRIDEVVGDGDPLAQGEHTKTSVCSVTTSHTTIGEKLARTNLKQLINTYARDAHGNRRLNDPNDFLRIETATTLRRNIPVIPILVDGAKVPEADQLPKDLEELEQRNALEIRHTSFHSDIDKLIGELKGASEQARKIGTQKQSEGQGVRVSGPLDSYLERDLPTG